MDSRPSTSAERMSQAELARDLGVSRQAINKLVKKGVIKVGRDRKINAHEARKAIGAHVHPTGKTVEALDAPTHAAEESTLSYHVAKTLREATEAKLAMLKYEELKDNLMRSDVIRNEILEAGLAVSNRLQQMASSLAPIVTAETDQNANHELISEYVHQSLTSLVAVLEKMRDSA